MYQAAIFFDNELQNISNVNTVCGPISSMLIEETPNLGIIPWDALSEFTSRLGTNKYYDLMKHLYKGESYDTLSGIDNEAIANYLTWEHYTRNMNSRACIVDWDRTLTKVEGFIPPTMIINDQLIYKIQKSKYSVPIEDFLIYLCGSKSRYNMLKSFFQHCTRNNVDIIVLTNNGAAADPKVSPMFQTIVDTFTGSHTQIIASSTFDYHKGIALQSHDRFAQLCSRRSVVRSSIRKSRRHRTRKMKK